MPFGETEMLKQALNEAYEWYKSGLTWPSAGIETYSRKALTQRMAALLNDLTKQT